MFAPLGTARRRKRRSPAADRSCLTAGCGTKIASWKWLCDGCFGQLPFDRKKEICAARASREPQRIFGLSRDAADWIEARRIKLVGGE